MTDRSHALTTEATAFAQGFASLPRPMLCLDREGGIVALNVAARSAGWSVGETWTETANDVTRWDAPWGQNVLLPEDLTRRDDPVSELERLFRDLPLALVFCANGRLRLNAMAENLTGYHSHEIPDDETWFRLLYPDRAHLMVAEYRRLKSEGYPGVHTVPLTTKSGSVRQARFVARTIAPELDVWVFYDVSEDVANEKRFLTLFESAVEGIVVLQDQRIVSLNPAAARMFGAARVEDVHGKHLREITPAEYLTPEANARLGQALQSVEDHGHGSLIWRHQGLDGRVFPVEASFGPVTYDNRPALIASVRDVSEREKQREDLREALETLDRAQSVSLTGSFEIESSGSFRYLSNELYNLLGLRRECPPPSLRVLLRHVPREDRRSLFDAFRSAAHDGYPTRSLLFNYAGSEDSKVLQLTLEKQPQGYLVGVMQDVTERENARTALARKNEELQIAKEHAVASARAKQAFLATMSHELRTPLSGVLGTVSVLLEQPLDSSTRGAVETIRASGESLLRLLDDILDYAKLEAGKERLESTHCDLDQVVRDVAALHLANAQKIGLRLITRIEGDGAKNVIADPVRLTQVLGNLLSNAIKFTSKGEVTLELHRVDHGMETEATFVVSDSGIGISPEQEARVFDRFEQAESSVRRRYGGTGLGLPISRRLVELMGGELRLESQVGVGSRFSFTLRLPHAARVQSVPTDTTPLPTLPGTHVLVAEDHAVNLRIAAAMLERLGCTYDVARDGIEAIRMAADRDYDIILMDVHMPECDGLAASRAIRRHEEGTGRRTPILAVTAAAMPEDLTSALEAGMDAVVTKPLNVRELGLAMRKLPRSRP